ncbi:hypothetical protein FRX31_030511 [Thalictrum thalictroides]|uniref:Uncharacterized protein n=1 Tax=Thalictrum thalictroides TaxID=46969 RepID=A0A7J6V658_THATH|nr:hypothetical protein FRX31_030511 [Thalictrum thalictroides]
MRDQYNKFDTPEHVAQRLHLSHNAECFFSHSGILLKALSPVQLGCCVDSLIPFHTAISSALFTFKIVEFRCSSRSVTQPF